MSDERSAEAGSFHDGGSSLSALLASSRTWESSSVPIGANLRRLSWGVLVGMGLLYVGIRRADAVDGDFFWMAEEQFRSVTDLAQRAAGWMLVVLALMVLASIVTSGFTQAGPRLQVLVAGTNCAGVAATLPASIGALIVALNVIGYIVLTLLITGVVLLALAMVLDV